MNKRPIGFRHFAIIGAATVLTCAFVWVRLQIVSISYDIHELEKQEHVIREDVNNLSLRINESKSPQRLERLAKDKFQMYAPKSEQLIVLREKK